MRMRRTLERGRRAAEALMTDRWRCTRGGTRAFDDRTGKWTTTEPETVYDGPGRLVDRSAALSRDEVQGETTVSSLLQLSLPVSATGIRVDDVFECIASESPGLAGTRVRVADPHAQTHATARRLSVEVQSWSTT